MNLVSGANKNLQQVFPCLHRPIRTMLLNRLTLKTNVQHKKVFNTNNAQVSPCTRLSQGKRKKHKTQPLPEGTDCSQHRHAAPLGMNIYPHFSNRHPYTTMVLLKSTAECCEPERNVMLQQILPYLRLMVLTFFS